MIDLEKLREVAVSVETPFFTINADEVLELLDHIEQLEKDAGRYRWLREYGDEQREVFGYNDGDDLDREIDAAMEAKHG